MTDWNNCNTNWKGNATPWGLLFWKWVGLEIRSYVILYRLKWQWQRHAYDIIRPKQFCGRRNLDYRRQAIACLSELLNLTYIIQIITKVCMLGLKVHSSSLCYTCLYLYVSHSICKVYCCKQNLAEVYLILPVVFLRQSSIKYVMF